MQSNVTSAVFDSRADAERAITELRRAGADNNSISIIGQQDGGVRETSGSGDQVDNDGKEPASFIAKAAAGSGIGALLGVAALAIPGVGPFVAAGAIAEVAIGGAALTGTAIGVWLESALSGKFTSRRSPAAILSPPISNAPRAIINLFPSFLSSRAPRSFR